MGLPSLWVLSNGARAGDALQRQSRRVRPAAVPSRSSVHPCLPRQMCSHMAAYGTRSRITKYPHLNYPHLPGSAHAASLWPSVRPRFGTCSSTCGRGVQHASRCCAAAAALVCTHTSHQASRPSNQCRQCNQSRPSKPAVLGSPLPDPSLNGDSGVAKAERTCRCVSQQCVFQQCAMHLFPLHGRTCPHLTSCPSAAAGSARRRMCGTGACRRCDVVPQQPQRVRGPAVHPRGMS